MNHKKLIQDIEGERGSRVITYVTSDRPGPIGARVAMDIIPIFSKQLRTIGKTEKIDLFIYSAGGDTMVPWRLVSMIREYCKRFSVVVPYKAHSAATMIALGADEIVMSDLSELSPIDPSTANVFNPQDPSNQLNKVPISVEDVMAYYDLAHDKFGIKGDDELARIFSKFIEASPQIHPLALGNVNRTHNLIRLLARQLLKSWNDPIKDENVKRVVEYFTEKLYSHQYFIGRKEAKDDLGVQSVVSANDALAEKMTALYEGYRDSMGLGIGTWNPENEIGINDQRKKTEYAVAAIESADLSNKFNVKMEFIRQQVHITQQTPQGAIQIPQEKVGFRIESQGWS